MDSSSSLSNPGGGGGGGIWIPGGGGGGSSFIVGATCSNTEETWLCITVACRNLSKRVQSLKSISLNGIVRAWMVHLRPCCLL